ncbi:type 1 glutamine amidotransferase domain-containing protein [Thermanaerothrix sp. 4228-RoL]|uniref:Type 1 glutamine amidotransferase domain-containing protein n=1 Tax=Thermanaerothrix solaris TaxID=3058434 RepID=A0ABU3NK72_9CHLR|nr:type 1 glutamine amidotransferase domain-containing protein [Thermanaerothrix sp. 4228-RoL]MDT8897219.1 type 1 glutamine amidotransferase domain-containing protein [Thermanaerothrix sp. 4228-RoL]
MRLKGMRVVYLIGPGFEDLEFYVPLMRLKEEGADVVVAGPKAGEELIGKGGLTGRAEVNVADLKAEDFDAIVVPGGWAPDKLRRYEAVKKLVRDFYHQGKVVAMICHAGLVGISAGIVKGHEATGSEGIKDDLINAGAIWRDAPAFRSGNIVWGRVVADIPDFCRELIQALIEQKEKTQKV